MAFETLQVTSLDRGRASMAKRAFTTRRVPVDDMRTLIGGNISPEPGDLVLASVVEIGKHTRLELRNGRRARMFLGDEIIVCFGNRYAPDQFEAVVGPDLSGCDLVAAGGIAARELARHERMVQPTRISPIGLIGDADGKRLNVRDYAITFDHVVGSVSAVLVAGTSMNSGKTLAAASLVRGLKAMGHRVAAIKATGTGAGGDLWIMRDVGADVVADFTDAGFASTYKASPEEIEQATLALIKHAAHAGCSVAVIEIADGLQQQETAALLKSKALRLRSMGVLFAAYDAMGAKAGVDSLRQMGHRVLAVSGRLTRSPLAIREAEQATGCQVFTPWNLQEPAHVATLTERSDTHYVSIPNIGHNSAGATADDGMAQLEPSVDIEHAKFNREMLGFVASKLMELEMDCLCGAGRGKRNPNRKNYRNGYRLRHWKTNTGIIDLRIPKLRKDTYFPAFLKARTAAEKALLTIVVEAQKRYVSFRSTDELVKAMGTVHVSQNKVLQLCAEIEEKAQALQALSIQRGAQRSRGQIVGPCNDIDDPSDDDIDSNVDYEVNGFENKDDHRPGAYCIAASLTGHERGIATSSDVIDAAGNMPSPVRQTRTNDEP